jgi:hypothetical protein
MRKFIIDSLLNVAAYLEKKDDVLIEKIKDYPEDKKRQLYGVLQMIEKMNWNFIIVDKDDFFKMLNDMGINPMTGVPSSNNNVPPRQKTPAQKLKPQQANQVKSVLQQMGFDNVDEVVIEDLYYGEEEMPQIAPLATIPENYLKAEASQKQVVQNSAYNFAVLYIYGARFNNYATLFSVDSKGKLFVHAQEQFTIKTANNIVDSCKEMMERFELDRVFLVETPSVQKIIPVVGLQLNEIIQVGTIPESHSFSTDVQNIMPLMSNGEIFVCSGPWLQAVQIELQNFLMSFRGMTATPMQNHFSRLKSFTYGVTLWQQESETDMFVRDYEVDTIEDNGSKK